MNNPNSSLTSNSGTASASRQSMGDDEGRTTENRLQQLDLEARGESLEDDQRNRDSKNVSEGYDDSLQTRKRDGEGHDYLGISRGD